MKNKGSRRSEDGGSNFQRFAVAATIVVCDLRRINMMMVMMMMAMMVMVMTVKTKMVGGTK